MVTDPRKRRGTWISDLAIVLAELQHRIELVPDGGLMIASVRHGDNARWIAEQARAMGYRHVAVYDAADSADAQRWMRHLPDDSLAFTQLLLSDDAEFDPDQPWLIAVRPTTAG